MVESILLNPNSYKNIETIMSDIREVNEDREWLFIGCGGPSYCLSERIAENVQVSLIFIIYPWVGPLTYELNEDTLSYLR